MNVKLLRKVQKHILEEPERLHMPVFRAKQNDDFPVLHFGKGFKEARKFAKCGTAACIGGWVCLLSGETYPDSNTAAALLGITFSQGQRLFYGSLPRKFPKLWSGDGTLATAKQAAKRIDLFIKTKGRE